MWSDDAFSVPLESYPWKILILAEHPSLVCVNYYLYFTRSDTIGQSCFVNIECFVNIGRTQNLEY